MIQPGREAVLRHYEVERELADRLRAAPAGERARVYGEVYDELFRRLPDHPQLAVDPVSRRRDVLAKLRFVRRFAADSVHLMELGAGDAQFSLAAAEVLRAVTIVEVSEVILADAGEVANLEVVVVDDGRSVPVEAGSIDVAYSDQLMEHLHPDDAAAQVAAVARALRRGGIYVCITPNAASGPHDISRGFDEVATGLHLHEYTAGEVSALFHAAGFTKVRFYAGGRGHYLRLPGAVTRLGEMALRYLPMKVRRHHAVAMAAYVLLGLNVVAVR